MAIEYRLASFRQPLEGLIPLVSGGAKILTSDMPGSAPELVECMDSQELISLQPPLFNDIEYAVTLILEITVDVSDIAAELS